MSELSSEQGPEVTELKRFIALNPGEYWKALKEGHEGLVKPGQLLMIAKVDEVDGRLHTVHVRLHPSQTTEWKEEVKYLADDFIEQFEHVDRAQAERIREQEIEAIQKRIRESQDELQEACADVQLMDKLIEQEMPSTVENAALPVKYEAVGADVVGAIKTQKITALMAKGLTETGIEQIKSGLEQQKTIAERRADWIAERTKKLSVMASEMTPYFEEKAALALALVKDMQDHAENLMKGIGSLNLYVLKNVKVDRLKEGRSADPELQLSLAQRVLYMDEELAVWADVGEDWDFRNEDQFLEVLVNNQGLVQQIFPSERSIVSIAATRKRHDYVKRGYDPMSANMMDMENQRQFLLVRDGENLSLVLSPELFHNYSKSLFPTTDETGAPFKGVNGESITYQDIDYTDALKKHEHIALGYKRLLILLCGLDHNKRLFGEFYPGEPSLSFVSLEFQEKYFNFIHDVDGRGLIAEDRPSSVKEWAKQLNKEIASGSRVLVQWREAMSVHSAPSCFEKSGYYRDEESRSQEFFPVGDSPFVSGTVKMVGGRKVLEIPVEGSYGYGKHRKFNAKLDIDYVLENEPVFAILCLDRINPEEAAWYLHDRPSRSLNIAGIRMLKEALAWCKKERERTQKVREMLLSSLLDGEVVKDRGEAVRLVDDAVAKWCCSHPSKDLNSLLANTRAFNALCNQLYQLSGKGKDLSSEIIHQEEQRGKKVVRVSILANGSYAAYSTPLASDRDDRLVSFYWLERTVYQQSRTGAKRKSSNFVVLEEFTNNETIVYQSDDMKDFVPEAVPFKTPTAKERALEEVGDVVALFHYLEKGRGDKAVIEDLISDFIKKRDLLTQKHGGDYVVNPEVTLPLGHMVLGEKYNRFGLFGETPDLIAWMVAGNEELIELACSGYAYKYASSDVAKKRMRDWAQEYKDKELYEILSLCELPSNATPSFVADTGSFICKPFGADKVYRYSHQKRLERKAQEGWSLYAANEKLNDLDRFFGISEPEDFCPLMVLEEGGFANTKLYVFNLDEKVLAENERELSVVSSYAELEDKYRFKKYTTSAKSGGYEEVTLEWSPTPGKSFFGLKPVQGYSYQEISRTPVEY